MSPPPIEDMLAFVCPDCGRATYHPRDIAYGYCSVCKLCLESKPNGPTPASYPPIWVIFEHPLDYPDSYVVRVHWGPWLERRMQLAGTLELAELACRFEGASVPLARFENDDPAIYGYWI